MSDDNKFSLEDILWEYADYQPPTPQGKPAAKKGPAAKAVPGGAQGMASPQPNLQPKPAAPTARPANQPRPDGQPLPANQPMPASQGSPAPAPGTQPAQGTPTATPQKPAAGGQAVPSQAPAQGGQPGKPQAPAQGGQPAQPQTPAQGGQPAQPQTPAQGGQPAQPQAPAQGGQPTQSQTPPQGGQAAQPQSPAQGDQPAQEGQQAQPAAQEAPADGDTAAEGTPPADGAEGSAPAEEAVGLSPDDGPDLIAFTPDPKAAEQAAPAEGQAGAAAAPKAPGQPGTQQTAQGTTGFQPFRERKARPEAPPPPDAAPSQLVEEYGPGLHAMKGKCVGSVVLCIPLLLLALLDSGVIEPLQNWVPFQIVLLASTGLFLVCAGLCFDVLREGLVQLTNLAPNGDTLALLATLFTLADGVTMILTPLREQAVPFFAPCGLVLTCHLLGQYCDRSAKFQSARVAASVAQPYVVTQDPGVFGNQTAFRKWLSAPNGFGSQLRTDSVPETRFRRLTPVLMAACVVLSLVTTVAHHQPKLVLWSLSALFLAASTLGVSLSLALPLRMLGKKLANLGVALAGWPGLTASKGCTAALLTDQDIYPPGTVALTGSRVFGSLSMERTVSFTASVIRASGSGLLYLFDKLLRAEGGSYLPMEKVVLQETGLIGQCQGQQVLVGNSDFMSRQGIALPPGIRAKDAVFCAVSGELAGMFVLRYTLPPTVVPALQSLLAHRVSPVMITRDFNLTPHRLRLFGRLPMDQVTFPDLHRRVSLSGPHQPHGATLLAVLCREGVAPFTQAIIGAKRIRRAALFSSVFVNLGACIGVLLTAVLSSAGALSAMCSWHLALFLLLWLVPVLLISLWTLQY